MENLSNSFEVVKMNENNVFENVISIEKLEERLETSELTCPNIMAF